MPARLQGLTILRFLAAFWVVLFHLQARVPLALGTGAGNFVENGAYAVTLFFILSGVVLTCGYHGLAGAPATRDFYLARAARIYPVYATVHLLALVWLPLPRAGDWVQWIFINGLSALGLQAWFPHALGYGVNGGTWTISAEFFFYALFPALLPLIAWVRRAAGPGPLGLGLVLLSGFFGLGETVFHGRGTFLYYTLPFLRLPEFMLGILLGLTLLAKPRPAAPVRPEWSPLLAAFVLVAVCAALRLEGSWLRANLVVVPAIAWLLYALARAEQQVAPAWRGRAARAFIYLGESSYCLFLFHLLPLLWLDSPAGQAWQDGLIPRHGPAALWCGVIVVSLAGAIALHELVEKPARRALLRRWRTAA